MAKIYEMHYMYAATTTRSKMTKIAVKWKCKPEDFRPQGDLWEDTIIYSLCFDK